MIGDIAASPPTSGPSPGSSSPSRYITVVDVYDLAEAINRDFEQIASQLGKESIEGLVKKVICALETLEAMAKNNDTENEELANLQRSVERLEKEKAQRSRDKDNLEKDINDMEENYKHEIAELGRIIKALQSENTTIKCQLFPSQPSHSSPSKQSTGDSEGVVSIREEEFEMLLELRQASLTQKERIKELQRDVDSYSCEVENLQNSIEKLIAQNKELLRKNTSLQKQGRALIQERAELVRRLQQAEEANFELRRLLHETTREIETQQIEKEMESSRGEDTPRFTLRELREVLQEKNILKARVLALEEQLECCRCSSSASQADAVMDELRDLVPNISSGKGLDLESEKSAEPPHASTSAMTNDSACGTEVDQSSEECVVYGPINREPDEKLHPWKYQRKSSGVRRFFRFFKDLSSPNVGAQSPRRTSSQQQHTAGDGTKNA